MQYGPANAQAGSFDILWVSELACSVSIGHWLEERVVCMIHEGRPHGHLQSHGSILI